MAGMQEDGMQEEFVHGVRELLKVTRPHVNYVRDFKRRAKDDPKGCAEEAVREIRDGARELQRVFKEAFGLDFEQAYEDTFYPVSDQQLVIRENAPLPDDPIRREFFLLWLYWLHFHRITLSRFLHLGALGEPNGEQARAICDCFVDHQLASFAAYLMIADDVAKQFSEQDVQQGLVEQFTAYFLAYTSLHTNKRLRRAMDELRGPDETRFERLIKEVSGEVLDVWREKRSAWKERYFRQADLMEMRTEGARRLEKKAAPPRETELIELAGFAEKEKMLKLARDAGLTAREQEVLKLFIENPAIKYREVADKLDISVGTVGKLK